MGIIKTTSDSCEVAEFGGLEIYLRENGEEVQRHNVSLDLKLAIDRPATYKTLREWQKFLAEKGKEVPSVPVVTAIFRVIHFYAQCEDKEVSQEARRIKDYILSALGISGTKSTERQQYYWLPLGTDVYSQPHTVIHRPYTPASASYQFDIRCTQEIKFKNLDEYAAKHPRAIQSLENLFGIPYLYFSDMAKAYMWIFWDNVALNVPHLRSRPRVVQLGVVSHRPPTEDVKPSIRIYEEPKDYVLLDAGVRHDMTPRRAIAIKVTDCR